MTRGKTMKKTIPVVSATMTTAIAAALLIAAPAQAQSGTGRSKSVPWGNAAATKKMKGLTGVGWAGVQWQ